MKRASRARLDARVFEHSGITRRLRAIYEVARLTVDILEPLAWTERLVVRALHRTQLSGSVVVETHHAQADACEQAPAAAAVGLHTHALVEPEVAIALPHLRKREAASAVRSIAVDVERQRSRAIVPAAIGCSGVGWPTTDRRKNHPPRAIRTRRDPIRIGLGARSITVIRAGLGLRHLTRGARSRKHGRTRLSEQSAVRHARCCAGSTCDRVGRIVLARSVRCRECTTSACFGEIVRGSGIGAAANSGQTQVCERDYGPGLATHAPVGSQSPCQSNTPKTRLVTRPGSARHVAQLCRELQAMPAAKSGVGSGESRLGVLGPIRAKLPVSDQRRSRGHMTRRPLRNRISRANSHS